MQTNWNWLTLFSKDGNGFYDLNKVKDEIGLDQFTAKDLQPVTVKGKLNGIPVAMTARIFYYNDQTWKKAGLSYPQNWDELMHAGKTFETKLGKQYYPVARKASACWRCSTLIWCRNTTCQPSMSRAKSLPIAMRNGWSFSSSIKR